MKKELIQELKKIHIMTYGDSIIVENLLSQIMSDIVPSSKDEKKAELVTDDVSEFFKSLDDAVKKGGLNKKTKQDLTYQKEVESLQIGLEFLGYNLPRFGVDGLYGPETASAVKKFNQENLGDPKTTDTNASPKTIEKMISMLKSKNIKSTDIKKFIDPLTSFREKYGTGGMTKKGRELLSDPDFSTKLEEVSKNLGIDKSWLISIMVKESGMNPTITNQIGCVGLIQFCPDTPRGNTKKIGKYRVNLDELKTLPAIAQLELIEEYYSKWKGRITSAGDLYILTFYPAAFGKPPQHVIGGGGAYSLKVSAQNPAIARAAGKRPGVDVLTVGDVKNFV